MTSTVRRLSAASLVLAIAVAQLALVHVGVFVSALAIGFQAHGHGHALTLVPDAGHLDVVLHHESEQPGHAPLDTAPWVVGAHDGDHVVHMASADGSREGARRAGPPPAALPFAPAKLAQRAVPTLLLLAAEVASSGAASLLRTVVLRV